MFGENVDGPGEYFAPHLLAYIPLIVVATAIVALRVFVKLRYVRNIGPEDYAVLFALVHNPHAVERSISTSWWITN